MEGKKMTNDALESVDKLILKFRLFQQYYV